MAKQTSNEKFMRLVLESKFLSELQEEVYLMKKITSNCSTYEQIAAYASLYEKFTEKQLTQEQYDILCEHFAQIKIQLPK